MKWLVAVLLLTVVLIAGCTQLNTAVSSISSDQPDFRCPYESYVKNYFQNSISSQFFVEWDVPNTTLLMGDTGTSSVRPSLCSNGKLEGQNVNYLYCNFGADGVYGYFIEIKDVSSSGVIEKVTKYKILEPIVFDTTNNSTVVEIRCQRV